MSQHFERAARCILARCRWPSNQLHPTVYIFAFTQLTRRWLLLSTACASPRSPVDVSPVVQASQSDRVMEGPLPASRPVESEDEYLCVDRVDCFRRASNMCFHLTVFLEILLISDELLHEGTVGPYHASPRKDQLQGSVQGETLCGCGFKSNANEVRNAPDAVNSFHATCP